MKSGPSAVPLGLGFCFYWFLAMKSLSQKLFYLSLSGKTGKWHKWPRVSSLLDFKESSKDLPRAMKHIAFSEKAINHKLWDILFGAWKVWCLLTRAGGITERTPFFFHPGWRRMQNRHPPTISALWAVKQILLSGSIGPITEGFYFSVFHESVNWCCPNF